MDYAKYIGTWVNTLHSGQEITQFRLLEENGTLMIETESTGLVKHWGKTEVYPVGMPKSPEKLAAFEAHYQLKTLDVRLYAYENKGLIIVAGYVYNLDNPEIKPGFFREFFYMQ